MEDCSIALALEKVQLHKRIALNILRITGTHANGVVLGFHAFNSSDEHVEFKHGQHSGHAPDCSFGDQPPDSGQGWLHPAGKIFALTIMLGIAFAANIGGMATL